MSTSRDQILNRLSTAHPVLGTTEPGEKYIPVSPFVDQSSQGLLDRFVEQAKSLASMVYLPASQEEAIQVILDLLDGDHSVLAWDYEHIPLPGLAEAFASHDIQIAPQRDASVRVGITGADVALAATGSLVLMTGAGKPRLASLLPPVHIVMIQQSQILMDLEAWVAVLRQEGLDTFRKIASAMIISGPSRTADIAMQLILGMHGPGELHILILR